MKKILLFLLLVSRLGIAQPTQISGDQIKAGAISNTHISSSAAISASKINFSGYDFHSGGVENVLTFSSPLIRSVNTISLGVVPVTLGGTGVATLTSGNVLLGAGTGPVTSSNNLSWNNGSNKLTVVGKVKATTFASGNAAYALPGTDGTRGQALTTNANGTTSWTTISSTQTGTANRLAVFNSGGNLSTDSGATLSGTGASLNATFNALTINSSLSTSAGYTALTLPSSDATKGPFTLVYNQAGVFEGVRDPIIFFGYNVGPTGGGRIHTADNQGAMFLSIEGNWKTSGTETTEFHVESIDALDQLHRMLSFATVNSTGSSSGSLSVHQFVVYDVNNNVPMFQFGAGIAGQPWTSQTVMSRGNFYFGQYGSQFLMMNHAGNQYIPAIGLDPYGTVGYDALAIGWPILNALETNAYISGKLSIYEQTASSVGLTVQGASGQTANLQEWKTSTPTTVASVSAAGVIKAAKFASGSAAYALPGTDGTSGQVLKTNADGTTSWITAAGGGTPAGADTQIQFNDGGSSFGGSASLIYNKTTARLETGILGATQKIGIGLAADPGWDFHLKKDVNSPILMVVENPNVGASAYSALQIKNATYSSYFGMEGSGTATGRASTAYIYNNGAGIGFWSINDNPIKFMIGSSDSISYLRLTVANNLITSTVPIQATKFASGSAQYALPGTDGTSGQVLKTNADGTTSWATVNSVAIGTDTQVTYNNAGTMSGSAGLVYNVATTALTAGILYSTDFDVRTSDTVRVGYYNLNSNNGYAPESVSIGWRAGGRCSLAPQNVMIGAYANVTDTFRESVAIGYSANAHGNYSTVVGANAGNYTYLQANNSLYGWYAGNDLRTGTNNLFMGSEAGYNTGASFATTNKAQTCSQCTFLGSNAGLASNVSSTNRIAVGYGAYVDTDYTAVIGNDAVTEVRAGSTGLARVLATGVKLKTGSKPTCDSTTRGTLWYVAGGAGVLDTCEVCRKDAADTYAWVTIF